MDETPQQGHRVQLAKELDLLWRAAGDLTQGRLAERVQQTREQPTSQRLGATLGEWRRGVQTPRDEELFHDVVAVLNDLARTKQPKAGIEAIGNYQIKSWPSWRKLLKAAQSEPRLVESTHPQASVKAPSFSEDLPVEESPVAGATASGSVGVHLRISGRPRTRSAVFRVLAVAGAAILVGAVALVFNLPSADRRPTGSAATTTATGASSAVFESPLEREEVASPLLAHGTADLPVGQTLWLFVQPPDGAYYPVVRHAILVDENGEWSTTVRLGKDSDDVNLAYDLHAIMAPLTDSEFDRAVARAEKTEGSVRFEKLPDDATRLAHVHVTLISRSS